MRSSIDRVVATTGAYRSAARLLSARGSRRPRPRPARAVRALVRRSGRGRRTHPRADGPRDGDAGGVPSVRMVLLKGHDDRGFVFYTNRTSRKATEIEANPRAAAVLYWEPQSRQVRVEGPVERLTRRGVVRLLPDAATRRAGSARGPRHSPGSRRPGRSRAQGGRDRSAVRGEEDVPLPPFWGGYRLVATAIEFWQGRQDRLHDRVRYELDDGALAPGAARAVGSAREAAACAVRARPSCRCPRAFQRRYPLAPWSRAAATCARTCCGV